MMPNKKYKKIDYNETPIKNTSEYMKYGFDRVEQLLYRTDHKSVYLPRTIDFIHLDTSIRDLFENGKLQLVLDGKKVPVFYMENERWGEFSKTWKIMDGDNNVATPYITVRRVNKEKGTRVEKPRVAQNKLFTYAEVPILDDGQLIKLLYKMPQPIDVDLTYEISLFSKYRVDVNELDKIIFREYASTQLYVDVNGRYFPTLLEGIEEADTIQDIDEDKLIVAKYNIKLLGSLQDEKEFKIVKSTRMPTIKVKTN